MPLYERVSRRHDIDFVFSRFGQEHDFFFNADRLGTIHAIGLRPPRYPLLPFRSRVLNKLSYWSHITSLSWQLARTLRRGHYDVFVAGDFGRFECVVTFLVARWRRRPFVLWSDNWHWPNSFRDRLRVPLVWLMIRGATALIAGGTRAHAKLVALGATGKPIFNVYDTNVTPKTLREPPTTDPPFVMYAGRLEERKGVEVLLRAFALIAPDCPRHRLKILGRGARLPLLRALAAELGVASAVDFVGWVEHGEIDAYYRACDVFVLPAVFTADGGFEPFSNVVLEAMAYGAAVITTTANGVSFDVIQSGVNGLVVPQGDVPALAQALRDVLRDRERATAMGRQAWHTITDHFNVDLKARLVSDALDYVTGGLAGRLRLNGRA